MALFAARESTTGLTLAPPSGATTTDVWLASIEFTHELLADSSKEERLITDFENEPFEAAKAIPVVVEVVDDGYVAMFVDANIGMSGDTVEEAVSNLESVLLDTLELLEAEPSERLGPEPLRQLQVLRAHIKRRDG